MKKTNYKSRRTFFIVSILIFSALAFFYLFIGDAMPALATVFLSIYFQMQLKCSYMEEDIESLINTIYGDHKKKR